LYIKILGLAASTVFEMHFDNAYGSLGAVTFPECVFTTDFATTNLEQVLYFMGANNDYMIGSNPIRTRSVRFLGGGSATLRISFIYV